PRDLSGYGRKPPGADWPGQSRVSVQFVLDCEEGCDRCVLHGDDGSEQFLSEIMGAAEYPDRHLSIASNYEYGSRVGVCRILNEFDRRKLPLTVFGIGMALERTPDVARAMVEMGHEIAAHGYRWIHYQSVPADIERDHMQRCL